jgi:Flp pilus assembly pilin Flp
MFHRSGKVKAKRNERGASLVEYALLVALIAVVCIGAVTYFGGSNNGGLGRSSDCIRSAYAGTTDASC